MEAFFESIAAEPKVLVEAAAVIGMCVIGLAAVLFGIQARVKNTRERERSRRELAAYIAEGTMTPDDAVRLLNTAQPVNLRIQR